jgi:hypothetical protein
VKLEENMARSVTEPGGMVSTTVALTALDMADQFGTSSAALSAKFQTPSARSAMVTLSASPADLGGGRVPTTVAAPHPAPASEVRE